MEEDLFEKTMSMKRLKAKAKLIKDVSSLFAGISKYKATFADCGTYGKLFKRKAVKTVYKDFVKGLKVINKKISVYVEMPKYKPEGDGAYSLHYDGEKKDEGNKEVIVHLQDEEPQGAISAPEESQEIISAPEEPGTLEFENDEFTSPSQVAQPGPRSAYPRALMCVKARQADPLVCGVDNECQSAGGPAAPARADCEKTNSTENIASDNLKNGEITYFLG